MNDRNNVKKTKSRPDIDEINLFVLGGETAMSLISKSFLNSDRLKLLQFHFKIVYHY